MLRNYIKTAWRNLFKNRLYSAINIFGLAIGLASCLLIGLYIQHELSYDRFHLQGDRIVRMTMEYSGAGTVNATATTGTKPGPQFKRIFPEVEDYVRTFLSHNIVRLGNKVFDEQHILYADPSFFNIFSFKLLQGDPAHALDAPDKIVLTKSMANKYFGNEEALNKTLSSGGRELKISAICEDPPQNSQIKFDFVTQFLNLRNGVDQETWWTANWITYLKLHDGKNAVNLERRIREYMNSASVRAEARLEGKDYLLYHLEPLKRVHLYSPLAGLEPNGSIRYIYIFSVIAVLILLIASANYTNLATTQSLARSSEIGMRKVMGATKKQVFMQFIGESAVICGLAAILALGLSIVVIPYFNFITGKHLTAGSIFQPASLLALAMFSLLVSFFAGLYPALILSGMQIMKVLKKGFRFTGGSQMLRRTLIILQFGISIFLIIYTIVILQQIHYTQTKNLGYDKDHILVLPITGNMLRDFQSLKDAFQQVRGVEAVTAAYETPEFIEWGDGINATDEKGKHEISLNAIPVDLDFTKTLKIKMAAGRDFQPSDFAMLDSANKNYGQPYLINETLARKIGWTPQQSIGRIIENRIKGPVLGVVNDFNFSSLHEPIGPLLIFLGRDFSRSFMLRLNGTDLPSTVARLENVWKQRLPDRPFSYHFLDEDYNKLYISEQHASALFGVAAGIAILLACSGLFGLAAFTTVQRTREIGIRRVLGAKVENIVLLISRDFLGLVVIAIFISMPLAWWASQRWLEDFAFRITLQGYVFFLTAAAILFIVLCTVGFHAVRASFLNPTNSLRSE